VEFEWDEHKRRANLSAHGIDFEDALGIWDAPVLEVPSAQTHHGEERFLAIGRLKDLMVTVVFTRRGENRRLISARIARRDEREEYNQAIHGTEER
jgi:uncharacterized DUF497 family protein